jgi:hypothetical protein
MNDTPGVNGIRKGFILKARKIEDSEIAHAPPCAREVWDWLLRKVNYRDRRCGKTTIHRGQILTSVPQIQEALHWKVGARTERYEVYQIETAMKLLRRWGMVATAKAGGGMFITVVNYETYQNPTNYESRDESRDESRMKAGPKEKKGRKEEKEGTFVPPTPAQIDEYAASIGYHRPNLGRDFCQKYDVRDWRIKGGEKMENWKLVVQTWRRQDERNPRSAAGVSPPEEKIAPVVRGADGRTPRERYLAQVEAT